MTSLWLAGRDPGTSASSTTLDDPTAEVVVVGAGITGLVTAVLLARAGKKVLVLEARTVGAGASGNTTAKISLLQGTKLSKIAGKHGPKLAKMYTEGNREGQAWLLRHCEKHGVAVQYEDAYTYAQSPDGVASARAEFEAGIQAGLDVQWVDDAPVPFPFH